MTSTWSGTQITPTQLTLTDNTRKNILRRRKVKGALENYLSFKEYIIEPTEETIKEVNEYRGNSPLMIELGSGCSGFSLTLAEMNPNNKYIAVEYKEELLLKAVKIASEKNIQNIRFLRGRIEEIETWLDRDSVNIIYLNFSDPWPKKRHHKRRLTHRVFLEKYKNVLRKDGLIEFKTDHDDMFDFSLEEFRAAGFKLSEITRDLHAEKDDIVMTEYEKKYTKNGLKIKYVKAEL